MVCTNDPDIASRARRLRNLGQRGKGIHYAPAVHDQPPFADRLADAPAARAWASEVLSLPMFPFMLTSEVEAVSGRVLRVVDELSVSH